MNCGNKIKHLIVDVRNNGGGTDPTFEKAFSYLTSLSFKENNFAYVIFNKIPLVQYFDWNSADKENQKREQTNYVYWLNDNFPVFSNGKYFQNQKYNPVWYPDSNRFKGKIYLLINENTASAASHFASLVKGYSDANVVGIETGGGYYGHNGHTSVQYILPHSKIKTEFSIVFIEQDAPKKLRNLLAVVLYPIMKSHNRLKIFYITGTHKCNLF
jgi:hypothetical protein